MILQVIVRDLEAEEILLTEYVEIGTSPDMTPAQAALAQAFLSHGIRKGRQAGLAISKDDLISMYLEKHMSAPQIGKIFGVSEETVRRFLAKNGVTLRPPGKYAFAHPAELRAKVVSLYTERGMPVARIRAITGLSAYVIRKILVMENVQMRNQGPVPAGERGNG